MLNIHVTLMGLVTVLSKRLYCRAMSIAGILRTAALCAALTLLPATAQANPKYAGIVVDAKTGKTLYASSADAYRFPASLTKIMTLYIVFQEIEAGRLGLDTRMNVSKYAAGRPPTKIGVRAGRTLKVKDAILALITKSANDASTVIAEHISGSESAFARRMTQTARQLGMSKTTFQNPHGLPNSAQRTTARDMATLGRAIQEHFPKHYGYFKTRSYTYGKTTHRNHNRLLGSVKGVDGIKTGYIRASGFNLVTSVNTGGRSIVAVVMGGRTGKSRNAQMIKLINRYLSRASKGKRTATPIPRPGGIEIFVASDMKNPPVPAGKPGRKPIVATGQPVVLANSASPLTVTAPGAVPTPNRKVPGFANGVPVPPKSVKHRLDTTFAVATALPPIPPSSPGAPVTTQSIDSTMLLAAARESSGLTGPASQTRAPIAPATPVEVVPAANIDEPVETLAAAAVVPSSGIEEDTSSDSVTVATSDTPDLAPSWQVQIAAAESETGAIQLLKKAKTSAGSALRGKAPHTEPVESNGKTLYRARFVGFETKTAARNACKSLKRAKFACYAIYQ